MSVRSTPRGLARLAAPVLILSACARPATAQDAAPPPSTTAPPASATAPAPPQTREALLEERLRRMEEMNQRLAEQLGALSRQYNDLQGRVPAAPASPRPADDETRAPGAGGLGPSSGGGPGGSSAGSGSGSGSGPAGGGPVDNASGPDSEARRGAPGLGPSDVGPGGASARSEDRERAGAANGKEKARILGARLDPGPVWESEDEEFRLEFHNLTQAEYRYFLNENTSTLHSQFFIPRQRWYFTGRVTKNIEFYTVINRGYGSLDLLDAFLNFNYDSRLQFRIGRMKTPFAYEYWQIAEGDLIAPERSLYVGNLSGNREEGAMFHGQLFEKSAEWALGVFNGPRRSFGDTNNAKDLYAYYNMRPFQNQDEYDFLKYLNVGGGYNFGLEQGTIQPQTFTTANDQTTATNAAGVSPTFLTFNNNVIDNGMRASWNAHIAWYIKSLGILTEYEGGYETFSPGAGGHRVKVPNQGYNLQAWYFITGETLTRRVNVIKPKKDFGIKGGRITGPGAIEVHARFSELNLGNQVFTGGLVDPNEWSNSASIVDTGFNWYPNEYTKFYFDWQHAMFGRPVVFKPGYSAQAQDMFWLRFQLYF
jgi:phosphate-selective porin OprO/OprP